MYCGVVVAILGVKGNVYKDMMQSLAHSRPSVWDSYYYSGFPCLLGPTQNCVHPCPLPQF